jgi:hypothetical protein
MMTITGNPPDKNDSSNQIHHKADPDTRVDHLGRGVWRVVFGRPEAITPVSTRKSRARFDEESTLAASPAGAKRMRLYFGLGSGTGTLLIDDVEYSMVMP